MGGAGALQISWKKKYNNHSSPVAILKKSGNIHNMIAGEESGYHQFCYRSPAGRFSPDPLQEKEPILFLADHCDTWPV
jgi:hypothetical protein